MSSWILSHLLPLASPSCHQLFFFFAVVINSEIFYYEINKSLSIAILLLAAAGSAPGQGVRVVAIDLITTPVRKVGRKASLIVVRLSFHD